MAKRFMYVCLGVLALAVAYHLGANSATSQPTETAIALTWDEGGECPIVLTDQGNIYWYPGEHWEWQFICNFPGGSVATEPSTLGEIKARFGE